MTHTEVPSWAIDDAIERERQDEMLLLVNSYGNARDLQASELKTHFRHQGRHRWHDIDECPTYQKAKTRAADIFDEIERRVRGCSPTPGFMETIDGR